MANVCGNFAIEGECGTCEEFGIVGVCTGICCANERYEEVMTTDKCDCGLYKKGNVQEMC